MSVKPESMPKGVFTRLMLVLLFCAASAVSIFFSVFLLLNANSALAYVIAISFTFLALISSGFNIMTSYSYYRSVYYNRYLQRINDGLRPMRGRPTVAIVMPVFNEDPGMVERNLSKLKGMNYDAGKLAFYLLDDSSDAGVAREVERIGKRYGAICMHRQGRSGFKAGALNEMLKRSKEKFLAIFDADEELVDANFLLDLLPYFQDASMSFVQTEKSYKRGSFFSDTVSLFDAIFFRLIQPSRVLNGTALYAGSCAVIRRSALDAIGGFPEYITEDTFMGFESDLHNFRSLHVPRVYALGKPIESFSELAKQQWRYNYGDTQFLLYFMRRARKTRKSAMSALSKMDYAAHGLGMNYLSSILILFTIVSMLIVVASAPFALGSIKQIFTPPYAILNLELLGMSAFLLSIFIPMAISKAYFNSYSKGVMMFALNFALAFVRLKGAVAALLSENPARVWFKSVKMKTRGGMHGLSLFRNAGIEIGFSGLLFAISFFSFLFYNISGALWLFWYGVLYSTTVFFFAKYG